MTDSPTFTTFSSAMQGAFARVASLRARANERVAGDPLLLEALAELDGVHEELHTAEEELHSQADELSFTRNALQLEQQRYRELFEAAPDAYIATDSNGAIEEINPRASELLNIDPAHARRKPLSLFVVDEDRTALRDLLNQLALETTRRHALLELRIAPRHASAPRWASASVNHALGPFGRPSGLRWLLRDITDAKAQALREEARNALIARQREQLLGMVAHELRTPLNAIASWNQLLMLEGTGASLRERGYGIIARNVLRLTRLIEDLLDHQRAEHGALRLEHEIVDLLPLLNTVLEDHALSAEIKGLQLSFTTQVESARVIGDALRLQQVLNNLLGNALKFTPNGGMIRVELACPGSSVEIRVIDSGRGLAPDDVTKIFGAFVQLGTRAGNPGLGLGLSIARHLVKLHGGTLTAHSAGPGRGAQFSLLLPLAAQ